MQFNHFEDPSRHASNPSTPDQQSPQQMKMILPDSDQFMTPSGAEGHEANRLRHQQQQIESQVRPVLYLKIKVLHSETRL